MKKPNKNQTYVCPLHQTFGQGMAYTLGGGDPKLYDTIVLGSQCKNNCKHYSVDCPKWK